MTLANDLRKAPTRTHGPALGFAGALLVLAGAAMAGARALPADLVIPALCALAFAGAALFALTAWLRPETGAMRRPSYLDVAGALTFIGICAAALVDPDQMVRLVEDTPRRP